MPLQSEQRTGPLNGFKVLDFTRAYAGPYAAMILADLGATVIKVEAPDGDHTRGHGPFLNREDKDCGLGGYNNSVNRNKKSISLDLKKPEAQEIAQRLAKECDAILINFSTPTIMAKYNLDYDTVSALNPKIVYVSISGYGTNRVLPSLFEGKPTIDMMMQAESGTLSITGSPDGEMYKVGPGIGDTYPGTCAVVGMLAALLNAQKTGKGQFVDIAMLDSMIMLTERAVYQYAYTGISPKPMGNRHPMHAPYTLYHTNDGAIVIAANPVRYWERLLDALGIDSLRTDPRFATKESRVKNQDPLDEIIEGWTKARSKAEAMKILNKHGCLAAQVSTAGDLFQNEHVAQREMLVEVEGHPKTKQKVKIAGTPFKFSETKANVIRRAPLLGEHSVEVLTQLGYSANEINGFINNASVIAAGA